MISIGAGDFAIVIAADPQKSSTQQLCGGSRLCIFAATRSFDPKYPNADISADFRAKIARNTENLLYMIPVENSSPAYDQTYD